MTSESPNSSVEDIVCLPSLFLSLSTLFCFQPPSPNSRVPETTGMWPSATEALKLRGAAQLFASHVLRRRSLSLSLHSVYDLHTVKSRLSGLNGLLGHVFGMRRHPGLVFCFLFCQISKCERIRGVNI